MFQSLRADRANLNVANVNVANVNVALCLTLCGDAPIEHALLRYCDILLPLSAGCMLTQ